MPVTVRPFLLFEGNAEEAMSFCVAAVPGSRVIDAEPILHPGELPAEPVVVERHAAESRIAASL